MRLKSESGNWCESQTKRRSGERDFRLGRGGQGTWDRRGSVSALEGREATAHGTAAEGRSARHHGFGICILEEKGVYGKVMKFLYEFAGKHARYACWCGWFGNLCTWTDTTDENRTHVPLCPRCFSRLK